jgi:uncharacterized protein
MVGKVSVILAIILVVSFVGNFMLLESNKNLAYQLADVNAKVAELQKNTLEMEQRLSLDNKETMSLLKENHYETSSKTITAVAVRPILISDGFFRDVRYEGTTLSIQVDIREGTGLILVNTAIPTGVDFQTSAKTAVKVAQKYTSVDLSERDIIFSISAKSDEELQAVDGPSAGMAMTVLLVLELQNKEISDTVLLTGTIREDGSMGPVGGIVEKAEAAGKHGAKTLIVPKGLAIAYVQECQESREGPFLYRSCKSEAKPLSPIMEEKYGMKVVEASDLSTVLQHF